MLQNLDLTSNSLYGTVLTACIIKLLSMFGPSLDLPVLLQSLRGCYRLKRLAVSGNPVTQEKLFRVYLLKAVPSLEVVEEKGVGVGLKCNIGKSRSSVDTLDILTSSNIYMTCLRQIQEQDNLKEIHCQKLQYVIVRILILRGSGQVSQFISRMFATVKQNRHLTDSTTESNQIFRFTFCCKHALQSPVGTCMCPWPCNLQYGRACVRLWPCNLQ